MSYKVPIDAAGRVVIPKTVRDGLHLRQGTILDLEVDGERLVLSAPRTPGGSLTEQDGLLVAAGELVGPLPTLDQVRAERIRQLSGL